MCEMPTKPVHPFANGFPADDYASLGEQILYIRRAQREPMVGPNGVGDDLARETKAFKARHLCWDLHGHQLDRLSRDSKLAFPLEDAGRPQPARDDSRYWDVDHAAYGPVTTEEVGRFAQVAAANLSAANRMIPQVTHHDRADVTEVEAFRRSRASEASARGIRLTALAIHVRALARVLRDFPRFNASLDAGGTRLVLKDYVNIGVAVDTPHGLLVPVIREADRKGLWQIAAEITALSDRAKARRLRPEDTGGASMTITSLGGIGGTAFTPIVNPPELAILGITRIQVETVWEGDTPRPVPMLPLDLSYDHRAINGAEAARFLRRFCDLIEDPRRMLI